MLEREDGEYWEEWLQTHRVELNAMTTPEFIAWLDGKMAEHGAGKLIPPDDVIAAELEDGSKPRCAPPSPSASCARPASTTRSPTALAAIKRPNGDDARQGHQEAVRARSRTRMARPHRGRRNRADVVRAGIG